MSIVYRELLARLQSGAAAVLITQPEPPCRWLWPRSDPTQPYGDDLERLAALALQSGQLSFTPTDHGPLLLEPYFPEPRLVILGGGHISQPLATFSAQVGFAVTVVDDRPSFANQARFPEARQVRCKGFPGCLRGLRLDLSTFLVIVTRGHRHDLDCLRAALPYPTAYLGMIGSKRRVSATKELLLAEGFSQQQLSRVHAPIGLSIGAVTPVEIAVSILAELIMVKNQGRPADGVTKFHAAWPDADLAVLAQLAAAVDEPLALVTIVSTKGSVPRGVGAQMLVWPDGRTLGSIGGGCAEAEVATLARELSTSGGSVLHRLDMTGSLAEAEGMVCGGIMDVLVQSISAWREGIE